MNCFAPGLLSRKYVIDHTRFVVGQKKTITKFEDVAGSAVDDSVLQEASDEVFGTGSLCIDSHHLITPPNPLVS